jgi:hypothetical protein
MPRDLPHHHHHEDVETQPGPQQETNEQAMAAEIERLAVIEAFEVRNRLWLRAILPLLQPNPVDPDPNPRVQFAFDRMRIAACERAARILASDVEASA